MTHVPDSFSTERLILREPLPSDAEAIYEYASDPNVVHFMDYPPRTDLGELAEYLVEHPKRWDAGSYSWVMTVKPHDRPIGTIACSFEGHAMEFGYLVNRHYWGHGYATEAATALVDWAIGLPEICRVWATCDCENVASARVLEKCGLEREGRLRCYLVRPNISSAPRDAYIYARIR